MSHHSVVHRHANPTLGSYQSPPAISQHLQILSDDDDDDDDVTTVV